MPETTITYSGAGNDQLHGGDGEDKLTAKAGPPFLRDSGDDILLGGSGRYLPGGTGDDYIERLIGNNIVEGGEGSGYHKTNRCE